MDSGAFESVFFSIDRHQIADKTALTVQQHLVSATRCRQRMELTLFVQH